MIGFSLRTKQPFPIDMAPIFWKQLTYQKITFEDLEDFDISTTAYIRELRQKRDQLGKEGVDVVQNFTTKLSDGRDFTLCQNGENRLVRADNLEEYVKLVIQARQRESLQALAEVREGLKMVINDVSLLMLVDWRNVEDRVSGLKEIEVDKLRSITVYEGAYDMTTRDRFWQVFEEFTQEQRQKYLKFVWGRSRLPIDVNGPNMKKHTIKVFSSMARDALPKSHTCFFTLDLPQYESKQIMFDKLLLAIEYCGNIDNDHQHVSGAENF